MFHESRHRLRQNDLCDLLGCSRQTLWRIRRTNPDFPRPSLIGARIAVWDSAEIDAWLESQKEAAE